MPKGAYGYDVSGVQLEAGSPAPKSLALIAGAVQGQGTGGIPVVPPTPPGGNPVVGIQETRSAQNGLTAATTTIPAGNLEYLVLVSDDFVGTIAGINVSGTTTLQYSDAAQPGNTLPATIITRSAGSYSIAVGGPV